MQSFPFILNETPPWSSSQQQYNSQQDVFLILFKFALHISSTLRIPRLASSAIHAITEKYTTQRHTVGPAVLIVRDPPATQHGRVSTQHQW